MTAAKANQKKSQFARSMPGEGERANVHLSGPSEDGSPMRFNFDFSDIRAPERRFVADGVLVMSTSEGQRWAFVQSSLVGNKPRAIVDVHISRESVNVFLESLHSYQLPEAEAAPRPTIEYEPDEVIGLAASYVRVATTNSSTVIDLYYSSAIAIEALRTHQDYLFVEPIVRILTSPLVVKGFIEDVRRCVS